MLLSYPNDDDRSRYAMALSEGRVPVIDGHAPGIGGAVGIHGSDREDSNARGDDWTFGCVSLLIAYALLISRLIAGARSASERPGMLVIMAIATAMVFQIFINVGMALGFLPVIGVPLPLMSAGLSAILSTFIAIGFVVSVKMRRFVN